MLHVVYLMATIIRPDAPAPPYRQPQLAAGHGLVAMAFGGGNTIYVAVSADQGRTFPAPGKVAETGALALGRHRGPRVAILKDAIVISAIAGEKKAAGPHAHGLPEAGNIMTWRSTDRGRTWTQGSVINDVPGAAREGLHAMAAGPDGSLFAVWLDLRAKGTQLFGSRSTDGGVTWSKNTLVYASPDGTICQCCHPTVSMDASGRIWVMWRNALDGSRDLYLTSSSDGVQFAPARKLGAGTWKLNACPMDGGGLIAMNGTVTSAWRRDADIYVAGAANAETRLGPGKDVAIAGSRQGPVVAWTNGGAVQIVTPKAAQPAILATEGAFVNLVTLADGSVLAAWEAKDAIETQRVY